MDMVFVLQECLGCFCNPVKVEGAPTMVVSDGRCYVAGNEVGSLKGAVPPAHSEEVEKESLNLHLYGTKGSKVDAGDKTTKYKPAPDGSTPVAVAPTPVEVSSVDSVAKKLDFMSQDREEMGQMRAEVLGLAVPEKVSRSPDAKLAKSGSEIPLGFSPATTRRTTSSGTTTVSKPANKFDKWYYKILIYIDL